MHGPDLGAGGVGGMPQPGALRGILRVAVLGSVDDGKSTLVGRLLHDTGSVTADDLEAIRRASERRGDGSLDLSLLTDGLEAEREQGITIDVAWRHLRTRKRRYLLADAPGHAQYTRNAVTAASGADVALLLVDARKAVASGKAELPRQTRSHAAAVGLVRTPSLILLVNKMDAVGYDEAVFRSVVEAFAAYAGRLGLPPTTAVPVSALAGDNVATPGGGIPWYEGPTLLELLEREPLAPALARAPLRFPVQLVQRSKAGAGWPARGYMGRIEAGRVALGQRVRVLPGGGDARIEAIAGTGGPLGAAVAGQSVTLFLDEDLDIVRGSVIADPTEPPAEASALVADLCWFANDPAALSRRYLVKCGTATVPGRVVAIDARLDHATGGWGEPAAGLAANEIGRVRLQLLDPLTVDPYRAVRATGSLVLIEPESSATVAAGVVIDPRRA